MNVKRVSRCFKMFIFSVFLLLILLKLLVNVDSWFKLTNETETAKVFNGTDTVVICIGILSKLSAFSRRQAIRMTWMRLCNKQRDLDCNFFTDDYQNLDVSSDLYKKVVEEHAQHGDLIHMPIKGGHNFSLRLLWMIRWFTERYKFEYFLRVDDDYFVCIDHLMHDLTFRPKNGLYWGYLHCREHVVRIDEGFMVLSYDIIREALQKFNSTLKCHPFGDQAVALWVQESAINITYFADNNRVVHAATAYNQSMYLRKDICNQYIGLHGTYPNLMYKYWILSYEMNTAENNNFLKTDILPYDQYCKFEKKFDYRWFWPHVRFEPKLCRDNPTWTVTNEKFIGREDKGEEAIF